MKKLIVTTLLSGFLLSQSFTICSAQTLLLQESQRTELQQIFSELDNNLMLQDRELKIVKEQQTKSENQIDLLESQLVNSDKQIILLKAQLMKSSESINQATISLQEVNKSFESYRQQKNNELKKEKNENLLLKIGISYLILDKIKK